MVAEAEAPSRAITLDDVAGVVMRYYSIPREDLFGSSKEKHNARPRQAFMYLGRWVALETLASIGAYLGRDHSTVYHGSSKFERQRKTDAELDYELVELTDALYEIAGHRPPEVRDERPAVKLFDCCEITVSRYVFGLTDLMVTLASNGVPKRAWVERVEIDGGNVRIAFRWTRDESPEVAS